MGNSAPVDRTIQNCSIYFQGVYPNNSARLLNHAGCVQVFNALNKLELRTLEEIKFLMQQFVKEPLACLTLAKYFIANAGDVSRSHITDPELLVRSFFILF